jgi:hypothetical protein
MARSSDPSMLVGWREWVALPDLGLLAIRCKVDTGAATSALDVEGVEAFACGGRPWVRFRVTPFHRKRRRIVIAAEAPVVDEREVTSSNGHAELRVVIETRLRLGLRTDAPAWPIELTLTDRRTMLFPMLLGRQAMEGRVHVDPGASFRLGPLSRPQDFYG